ncbi:helix-turn-helix domain-containing protein [Roseospira marina]|uniref:helix-turn-helix domain-containing protein n=1 Tax=Roseospira marina TaxID=140057 RepID=UPI0017C4E7A4|nr:helix-turn-helix transcriptional regulator [Roseospira marina]MBB4314010.1 transcriptional regulator with XRE-family HTH domain [Roseospira marina]MBB5087172.1 transcriptional regulator with XRE-family HTH domain [Roseospira marina]
MTPKDFKHWRKGVMRMSQKEAAEALGLKRRVVQYYEKGERDGDSIDIPKTVRLACFALAQGVTDYFGPGTGVQGVLPDPAAGTRPAPDAVTGSKTPKKPKTTKTAPAKA